MYTNMKLLESQRYAPFDPPLWNPAAGEAVTRRWCKSRPLDGSGFKVSPLSFRGLQPSSGLQP